MSLEANIVTALNAYAPLTAILGTRVYWQTAPEQPTLPYIVYHRVSTPRVQTAGGGKVQASMPRFQFDIWTTDSVVMDAVSIALKDGLLTLFSSGKEVQFVDERQLSDTRALLDHCQLDVKFVHAGY